MIGETVKLGWDGSSVKRGLASVMSGFGKLNRGIGRGVRQVGIGAARRLGSDLFGAILSTLQAIPNEIDSLSKLNKELQVMATSTGVAKDEYLALREAISKTTGLDPDESVDFLRDVSERIGEALADFESTPRKAMIAMGIRVRDVKGRGIDEQLEAISRKFNEFRAQKGPEAAMFQINELLGEIGKKMVPLFDNYGKQMDAARLKTAGLASQIKGLDGDLESVFDIKLAVSRKFSEFSLGILQSLKAFGVEAGSISEFINSIDVAGSSTKVAGIIGKEMQFIRENGIWEWIKTKLSELGTWLSETITTAITDGIKGALPSLPNLDFNIFKKAGDGASGLFKMMDGKTSSYDASGKGIERNTAQTNNILQQIANNGVTATYA